MCEIGFWAYEKLMSNEWQPEARKNCSPLYQKSPKQLARCEAAPVEAIAHADRSGQTISAGTPGHRTARREHA